MCDEPIVGYGIVDTRINQLEEGCLHRDRQALQKILDLKGQKVITDCYRIVKLGIADEPPEGSVGS